MQEVIERILEGNFDYEKGSLDFSCPKVEITLQKGEVYEGSFSISSEPGRYTEGRVSSPDLRMECLTPVFTGENEEVSYRFHGEYLEEGEVVKGNFCIVSNMGEYYLPFVVSVAYGVLESCMGGIKNLFHFANLAKSNWREAVRLFYTPEFTRLLTGNDSQFYDVYRGLSVYPGNEQNVEEFLIRINKKQKIGYVVQEETLAMDIGTVDSAYAVAETALNITRNGWGYTALHVECEGEFVFTEKELLTDDDFLGNRCRLPVFIDTGICRIGKNFGRIHLYNSYVSLTIPVVVSLGNGATVNRAALARRKDILRLMELYRDFRLKKIGTASWLKGSREIVERMVTQDEQDVEARLFQAQLLISDERYHEARWVLDHTEGLIEREGIRDNTLKAYLLYLTTLIRREEDYTNRVASQVERLYRHEPDNWRAAWLLLYLSEEYNKSAAGKWDFLERQFDLGCTSPVFYIEALQLLNGNPLLLRKLNRYSMQVLYFGVRHGVLSGDVMEQVLYLAGKIRGNANLLLKILVSFYENRHDVRVLQEICALLIRENRVGPAYFGWYEAGVKANLRITNLYEHYMMSIDLQASYTFPKTILLYFAYQSNLDYIHKSYLYQYVLQNRAELGEIYDNYRTKIELFVLDQIQKEHINRPLAELYRALLTPDMINGQTAGHLANLLFAHQVRVDDPRLKKVLVYQPDNLCPGEYPLQDGVACMPIYGNDYTVLFEDAYGNRFAGSVDYILEKLMIPGKNLHAVGELATDSPELDLYLCAGEKETETLAENNVQRAESLARSEQIDISLRRKLYLKLLNYYYDRDDAGSMDRCLESIPGEGFTMEERAGVLRYIVLRNRIEEAWQWVVKYGPYFADPKVLMRLVSEVLVRNGGMKEDYLVRVAYFVFQCGKYDDRILQYLVDHMQGTSKELRNLWKAARSFELDCRGLSERILIQMLYSGAFVGERMEIFEYYAGHGGDSEVTEAFLTWCSYDYFVRERLTDGIVFEEIYKRYQSGRQVSRICRLAFLKYYGENVGDITPEILSVIGVFLQDMIENRIHLNVFRSFCGMDFPQEYLLREMMDKTIVEYHAHPGARAKIHYVVLRGDDEEAEYLTENMREIYGGICFKEWVLFFGETLQYYIVEEANGEEQLTESGNIQNSGNQDGGAGWRYDMINDIAISKALQDYDTFDSLVDEYFYKEYLYRELFALK